jgi:transposase
MVGKWRNRFIQKRTDGLLDEPRPGAPRKISDKDVERVITLTLESKPKDATQWSTRGMAKRCGMSQSDHAPHRSSAAGCLPAGRVGT